MSTITIKLIVIVFIFFFENNLAFSQNPNLPQQDEIRQLNLSNEKPTITVVIAGLGLSKAATQAAIQQLPAGVTLSFSPLTKNLNDWIAQAKTGGHEVILQLPTEIINQGNLKILSIDSNQLDWLLSETKGYVGVTNYQGPQTFESAEMSEEVIEILIEKNVLFLNGILNANNESQFLKIDSTIPISIFNNDLLLDTEASRASIDENLLKLEAIAEISGNSIGIGYSYPVTIERLAAWIDSLQDKNMVITPISLISIDSE